MTKVVKENAIKAKTLFDHLKNITEVQDPNYFKKISVEDKKTWGNFMIIRFLSMNADWTEMLGNLQPLTQTLEPEDLYRVLITILPKRRTYLKYVKGRDEDKYEKWLVDLIAKDFYVSKSDAIDYLNILYGTKEGRETILYICEKYGTDTKQIKTLKLNL
jgi:hypothetical protein